MEKVYRIENVGCAFNKGQGDDKASKIALVLKQVANSKPLRTIVLIIL